MIRRAAALFFLIFLASGLSAQERTKIGRGWLLTNDVIGDGEDRWRTGSFAASHVWGPDWAGRLPEGFGRVLELRINGQVITPENLVAPAPGDRPFAGALSFGLHTHFGRGSAEFAVGADLVFTGSQTQLDHVQDGLHDIFGGSGVNAAVRGAQVGNDIIPTLVAEAGRPIHLGPGVRLRPFVEGRVGVETMARAGADLMLGAFGGDVLMVREPVTGQRYRAAGRGGGGFSFLLGADVAYVEDSAYLPSSSGVQPTDSRSRVRAGMHWQGRNGGSVFYGLTWLDEEFKAQREGQVVGSVRLTLKF